MQGSDLVEMTCLVAFAALVGWRWHRWWSRKKLSQKRSDLEVVDELVEEAISDQPSKSAKAISRAVVREMTQRGYAEHVIALVTPSYVEELRRMENRRFSARHHAREKAKLERARKGSPYRMAEGPENEKKKNLRKLLETAGVDPDELGGKRR